MSGHGQARGNSVLPNEPRIHVAELQARLLGDSPPLLLDIRSAEERKLAHLPGDRWIPLNEIPARASELPPDRTIVVYCHRGAHATRAADLLRASGVVDVAVLDGGIDEYARVIDPALPRYGEPVDEHIVLQQFAKVATGCLAYLMFDPSSREAVIVDPGREIDPYLNAIHSQHLTLTAIVETHTHADHLSGHGALHLKTDAPIRLSERSRAQYPHGSLTDGEAIQVGANEIIVWATPGHTPDHLAFRWGTAVVTGDTLLPGSCGRTDLGAGDPDLMWESLMDKLLPLPDATEVMPAHYGHLHGLPPPEVYSTTIGYERRTNEALLQPDRESFRRYMTEGWPPKPANFETVVRTNLRE